MWYSRATQTFTSLSALRLSCLTLLLLLTACTSENFTNPEVKVNAKTDLTTGVLDSADIATFTIVLARRPSNNVSILIRTDNFLLGGISADRDQGRTYLDSINIIFTTANWSVAKRIFIKGFKGNEGKNDETYNIIINSAISVDPSYNGIGAHTVTITNLSDSVPVGNGNKGSLIIVPRTPLTTSEDRTIDSFQVSLSRQPENNHSVTVLFSSSNINEGDLVQGSQVAFFDNEKWQQPITIQVKGADDAIIDGPQIYNINITTDSGDPNFDGLTVTSISVVNTDNEAGTPPIASVTVTPRINLVTSENGLADTFTVKLTSRPAAGTQVNVSAVSSNPLLASISPISVTFDDSTTDWLIEKTFIVTGLDDNPALPLGDNIYSVNLNISSTDSAYNSLSPISISATNQDNDVAAATPKINVTPTVGLTTTENVTPVATFEVALNSQPTATVSITSQSSDISEGKVTPSTLNFTTTNWESPQVFTITGQDDNLVDGPISYTINMISASSDTVYGSLIPNSVSVVNLDNDNNIVIPPDLNTNLFIEPAIINVTDSPDSNTGATTINLFGYAITATPDGQSPGPIFELVTGQVINLTLINESLFDHIFESPPALNAQTAVAPGGSSPTFFSFSFNNAGIYRYGSAELAGRGLGYFGAIVVKSVDGSLSAWMGGPSYDKERNWILSDVDTSWLSSAQAGGPANVNTTQYNPNYFFINGKNGFAAMEDVNTNIVGIVGEKYLIRILNAGQFDQSLHFHGNHFAVISQDGINDTTLTDININEAITMSTINIKRNSSAMILYTLKTLGKYPIHVHTPNMLTGNGVYLNGVATSITVCTVAITPCPDL